MIRAAVLLCLLLGSPYAAACSRPQHAPPPWPVELRSLYRHNAHVFVGRFETIQFVTVKDTDWPGERRKRASFTVVDSIKGNPASLPYLETGFGSGDCAPGISEKKPYIIMADSKGVVFTAWAIAYPPINAKDRSDLRALKRMAAEAPNRRAQSTQKSGATDAKR